MVLPACVSGWFLPGWIASWRAGRASAGIALARQQVPLPQTVLMCCVLGACLHADGLSNWSLVQVEQYRGEADPSQELVAFVLRSTPMRQQLEQQPAAAPPGPKVPYLPSGSIVSGLTAALITQAELRALPAELLVVVEQVPSLVPETLGYLGKLLVGSLQQVLGSGGQAGSGGEQQWGAALLEGGVVDAARLKLQRTAYRPTSVYS